MTIVEAIKELRELADDLSGYPMDKAVAAAQLGIEALKYIQKMNSGPGVYRPLRLPGETEE